MGCDFQFGLNTKKMNLDETNPNNPTKTSLTQRLDEGFYQAKTSQGLVVVPLIVIEKDDRDMWAYAFARDMCVAQMGPKLMYFGDASRSDYKGGPLTPISKSDIDINDDGIEDCSIKVKVLPLSNGHPIVQVSYTINQVPQNQITVEYNSISEDDFLNALKSDDLKFIDFYEETDKDTRRDLRDFCYSLYDDDCPDL